MLLYRGGNLRPLFESAALLNRVEKQDNFIFSDYTTYRLGGSAKAAYFPSNLIEAKTVYDNLKKSGENLFVLANGSNLLVSDSGYDGTVLCTKKLKGIVRVDADTLFVLSGTSAGSLLRYCECNGLGGLEYLAGIPATIGGIACMNGGAGGRYISSNIISVRLYNGKDFVLSNKNCNFTYKHSTMRDINALICGVFLSVFPDLPQNVGARVGQYLSKRSFHPKGYSCGCVFKNPSGMSAGAVIESCRLSGYGSERAFVSPKHCNFIINNGATAGEVKALIDSVKRKVFNCLGIVLEEEVILLGDF